MYNYDGLRSLDRYQYSSCNMKKKINDIEIFNIFNALDKAIEDSKFDKRNIYVKGFFNLINQNNKNTRISDLANFNVNIDWLGIQNNDLKKSINGLSKNIQNTFEILRLSLKENEQILKNIEESEKRIRSIFERRKNDFVLLNNQLDLFSKILSEAEITENETKKEISNMSMASLRDIEKKETDLSRSNLEEAPFTFLIYL